MPTREKYHGLMIRRYHELKTDTADIGFYLIVDFFIHPSHFLLIVLLGTDLLYEMSSIALDSLLDVHFLLNLFSLSLLAPHLPLLLVKTLLF